MGVIFQSARDGLNVAGEACEDVDGALLADHIGENNFIVTVMLVSTIRRRFLVRVEERGKGDVGDVHDRALQPSPKSGELGECGEAWLEEQA